MLQLTLTTLIMDTRLRADAIAYCGETGANLIRSREQYVLIIPTDDSELYRYWSRRKVLTDEDAIARAQRSLDQITKTERSTGELRGLAALIDVMMAHPLVTHYYIVRARVEHFILHITGKQCPWCKAFKREE